MLPSGARPLVLALILRIAHRNNFYAMRCPTQYEGEGATHSSDLCLTRPRPLNFRRDIPDELQCLFLCLWVTSKPAYVGAVRYAQGNLRSLLFRAGSSGFRSSKRGPSDNKFVCSFYVESHPVAKEQTCDLLTVLLTKCDSVYGAMGSENLVRNRRGLARRVRTWVIITPWPTRHGFQRYAMHCFADLTTP